MASLLATYFPKEEQNNLERFCADGELSNAVAKYRVFRPFITTVMLEKLFIDACSTGQLEVAQWIYNIGDVAEPKTESTSVTLPTPEFEIDCDGNVIIKNMKIHIYKININDIIEDAFIKACNCPNAELIKWLHGLTNKIEPNTYQNGFLTVCKFGDLDSIKWFASTFEFGDTEKFPELNYHFGIYICRLWASNTFHDGFITAFKFNHVEVVKWLWNSEYSKFIELNKGHPLLSEDGTVLPNNLNIIKLLADTFEFVEMATWVSPEKEQIFSWFFSGQSQSDMDILQHAYATRDDFNRKRRLVYDVLEKYIEANPAKKSKSIATAAKKFFGF